MNHTYFITGYPGFIASKLVDALQKKYPSSTFYLLILKHERELAERKLAPQFDNVFLIEGDITKQDLGLSSNTIVELYKRITHSVHLAALYDLTIAYEPAHLCNVIGTKNVLTFVSKCPNLKRFCYFSTAYVSGDEKGLILENDISMPNRFRNYYEQTKHEAEVLVRDMMDQLPITIIRPGIIVGDSKTGETLKFDGPYFMMQFIKRLAMFPIPYIGKTSSKIHLVPVDFIIEASLFLMHDRVGESKTYHVLSPDSPSIQKAYTLLCQELSGKKPSWTLNRRVAERCLSISYISKWLGVPLETLSYFSHDAIYDTSQLVKDLEGSGIVCRSFEEYVGSMVHYYKNNAKDKNLIRY
ncbi:SDR family oxidoreductase [Fictibacillus sp. 23RED33]|uniref:SDR family oxidoreductase n=1 Tax=Fictibacillus sp. 23RED33 TaxID=2745879 RepID=UPI0018CF19A4|nr:SDR family oxidoreductase [Fictibacillus sp. 23RED33]MBH0173252.1 SDR family oxidoreductase [Fictibacillus sp. 23RED33]